MLQVKIEHGNTLRFLDAETGSGLGVTFQRTLRIPDDGRTYPLPPGLGAFPLRRVLDYRDRVPAEWVKTSGVFLPMLQREALWISFQPRHWRPNAVKVAAGKINAVSGRPWSAKLEAPSKRGGPFRALFGGRSEPEQDYLVVPPQPWLDGFKTGSGTIKQFVAMPLGMGYTVEGQLTGQETHGGLQLMVFEPRRGLFAPPPPAPPLPSSLRASMAYPQAPGGPSGAFGGAPSTGAFAPLPAPCAAPQSAPSAAPRAKGASMGLAAGGAMTQKVYADPHGLDVWDEANTGRVFVHIVNSVLWREITGEAPPESPVTARSYTNAGYPWFSVYDEDRGDVAPSSALASVKSVAQLDASHGFVGLDDDNAVDVASARVHGLGAPRDVVPEGDW